MASVLTLKAIDQVIANLVFRDENVLSYRLVTTIRRFYHDGYSIESLEAIKSDDLIKALWNTGDDPEEISGKRKSLSSIKSSVNAKLRELYRGKGNPDGIIIGRTNIFVMCDEAKDNILKAFLERFTTEGTATVDQISDVLRTVDKILSNPEAVFGAQGVEGSRRLGELKGLVEGLSEKLDIGGPGLACSKTEQSLALAGNEREVTDAPDFSKGIQDAKDTEVVPEDAGKVAEESGHSGGVVLNDEMRGDEPRETQDIEGLDTWNAINELDGIEVDEEIERQELKEDLEEVGAEEDTEEAEIEEELEDIEVSDDLEEDDSPTIVGDTVTPGGHHEANAGMGSGGLEEMAGGERKAVEYTDLAEEIMPEEKLVLEESHEIQSQGGPVGGEELLEEPVNIEIDDDIEEADIEEGIEEIGIDDEGEEDIEEIDEAGEARGTSISMGDLGGEYSDEGYEEDDEIRKARLLAEEFNSLLGARDKYYNQYILIPQGEYIVGGSQPKKDAKPEQMVHLSSFYMGKFQVTNGLFEIFVEKTGYRTTAEKLGYGTVYRGRIQKAVDERSGCKKAIWNPILIRRETKGACWYQPSGPGSTIHNKRDHPVVQVSLEDAMAFAAWTGKRPPTEDEWEAASRTAQSYVFPWGDEWRGDACNIEESNIGDTTPVDKYIEFANGFGIADAVGNVLEWTSDRRETCSYAKNESRYYICKGGSWISGGEVRLFSRFLSDPELPSNIIGFRCVAY